MNTKKIRTRQERQSMTNPKAPGAYIIGLDVGYSSVKVFYENGSFVFPSFIQKLNEELEIEDKDDILYRDDETNEIYLVGYNAQKRVQPGDTNTSDGELFSRKRYSHKLFHILCQTAIGLASEDKRDAREYVIQTGLPSAYLTADTPAIKKAISESKRFSVKRGFGGWKSFELAIPAERIFVMEQPLAGMYSVSFKSDGRPSPEAKDIFSSSTLVMDIGFGTFDFFEFTNRQRGLQESFDDCGMKAVLKKVSQRIAQEHGEDVSLSALQSALENGYVTCYNEEDLCSEDVPINTYCEEAMKEVAVYAMEKAKSATHSFRGYKYIIIDGGTGEAWFDYIKDYLKGLKGVRIMPCNYTYPGGSFIYANARGYYMFRYGAVNAKAQKKAVS